MAFAEGTHKCINVGVIKQVKINLLQKNIKLFQKEKPRNGFTSVFY